MALFDEQFHDTADTDLFVVGKGAEPSGELVVPSTSHATT